MKKVVLMCDTGISARMLVSKMQDEAQTRGIDIEITSRSVHDYRECAGEYDLALLAPQIRHRLRECQQSATAAKKTVACIEMDPFWNLDSGAVLNQALELLD